MIKDGSENLYYDCFMLTLAAPKVILQIVEKNVTPSFQTLSNISGMYQ